MYARRPVYQRARLCRSRAHGFAGRNEAASSPFDVRAQQGFWIWRDLLWRRFTVVRTRRLWCRAVAGPSSIIYCEMVDDMQRWGSCMLFPAGMQHAMGCMMSGWEGLVIVMVGSRREGPRRGTIATCADHTKSSERGGLGCASLCCEAIVKV